MDTPMQTAPVQSVSSGRNKRRVLLTIIVIVMLVAVGWLIYKKFFYKMSQEEYRMSVLKSVAERSPAVPDEVKIPILEKVAKESAPTKTNPGYTDEQKAQILKSLSERSSQTQ